MKTIIVCPPVYYRIEYSINPWMDVKSKVNKTKVFKEYHNLIELYKKLGGKVVEIVPENGLPDMVYTANAGYAERKTFIKANFKFSQRKKEADIVEDFFKNKLGFKTYQLPKNIFFEGTGDLFKINGRYFFGWGPRSDKKAKKHLEKILNKPIIDLELVNPYFYHLDTCFGPLSKDIVLINPKVFTKSGLEKIKKYFKKVIQVSENDNQKLACNLIVIDNNVIISQGISLKLANEMSNNGFNVYEMDMSEYLKGGGSVKCVSLMMN